MKTVILSIGFLAFPLAGALAQEASSAKGPGSASEFRYVELDRQVTSHSDHTVTFIRVRPPKLPLAPRPAPAEARSTAVEASAEAATQKAHVVLAVSAVVYLGDRPVTELRWRDATGRREFKAWTNADFRYLRQIADFETETTTYSWFPFIEAYPAAEFPAAHRAPVPKGLRFSATETEYLIDAGVRDLAGEESTLAGLDHLIAFYQIHREDLKATHDRLEAEQALREKSLRENPPKTPDATLRWWPLPAPAQPAR